jgi:hypothetical protein
LGWTSADVRKPFHFTHQSASWVPFTAENVRYPDTRAEVEWFLLDRKGGTESSPKLSPGDTPWTFYPGAPFRVDDPTIVVGKPVLVVKANSGRVYFDDLVLEELAADGSVKRELWRQNLTGTRGWFFWTSDGKGGAVPGSDGHGDNKSITVAGTQADANLGSDVLRFRTERGATYRLSGWMRGVGIPATATCQIRLDFFSSRAPVQESDKKFVAQELDAYLAWGKRHKVPLFLGEWGRFVSRSTTIALGYGGWPICSISCVRGTFTFRTTRITKTPSAFTAATGRCPIQPTSTRRSSSCSQGGLLRTTASRWAGR